MREVAERAGVSITTVSHVINRTRKVSEELTNRVHAAMEELDYRPNLLARGLRKKESKTIGVVLPDISNSFFADIARAIEDTSFAHGFSVILCNTDDDLAKEIAYSRALSEKQVDGIIFVAAGKSSDQVRKLQEQKLPVVIVDRPIADITADTVLTDDINGGWLGAKHLIELGHTRIACIMGPSILEPAAQRMYGYRKAMQEEGLFVEDEWIVRSNFRFDGGRQAAIQLLALPQPPTAIFASNDMMAFGAISAAKEMGLMIPDDLSIVGFDDILMCAIFNPALTSINQPKDEIGALATNMLLDRIENPHQPTRREMLDTTLVVRKSTASPTHSRLL